jgi:hypothetical protein
MRIVKFGRKMKIRYVLSPKVELEKDEIVDPTFTGIGGLTTGQ